MKITIVAHANSFENFYHAAIKEYTKRLSRYCKISLELVKSPRDLAKKIPSNSYKIKLSKEGEHLSSEELSNMMQSLAVTGHSTITFIICDDKYISDRTLTISPMDMNRGLLTAILYEQIYRGFRIMHNHAYHK